MKSADDIGREPLDREIPIAAAEHLVRDLKRQGLYESPPFPIEHAATTVGIRKIVHEDIPQSGRLVPIGEDYVVELNADEHPARRRFTLAHEIAHVLVARAKQPGDRSRDFLRCRRDDALERLCDAIAGRLLMPGPDLLSEVDAVTLTLPRMEQIARRFHVSWSALAVRIAEVSSRYVFVYWQRRSHVTSAREAYRVRWSASPRGIFVPRDDACAPDCIVEHCASTKRSLRGAIRLRLGTLRGTYDAEAKPRYVSGNTDVVLLLDTASKR